jgi:hypothetical protein
MTRDRELPGTRREERDEREQRDQFDRRLPVLSPP